MSNRLAWTPAFAPAIAALRFRETSARVNWQKTGTGLRDAFTMSSLVLLSATKSPFDPPTPEPVSPIEVIGGIALVAGIVVVDTATGGLLSFLDAVPAPRQQDAARTRAVIIPGMTSAPKQDRCGNVQCSRCSVYVAYQSMSLSEHGYFCSRCAATIAASAAEQ